MTSVKQHGNLHIPESWTSRIGQCSVKEQEAMNARTSKQHNCRHWGNVALPQYTFNSTPEIHTAKSGTSQQCLQGDATPERLVQSLLSDVMPSLLASTLNKDELQYKWKGLSIWTVTASSWRKTNIQSYLVSSQSLKPKQSLVKTWRDNSNSASRLMFHTPQGNTAGIVQHLTLSILTNNQVHIQIKRKWVVSEAKAMGLTHYQQSNICAN